MAETTCRSFLGVLYPDAENYNCEEVLDRLKLFFPDWAYIVHDMDVDENGELKKPHIHWIGQRSACHIDFVASSLGVPENTIEFCRKYRRAVRYLVHKDSPSKYQYEIEKIEHSFDLTKYFNDDFVAMKLGEIVDFLYSDECTTLGSLFNFCAGKGYTNVLRMYYAMIKDLYFERMKMK